MDDALVQQFQDMGHNIVAYDWSNHIWHVWALSALLCVLYCILHISNINTQIRVVAPYCCAKQTQAQDITVTERGGNKGKENQPTKHLKDLFNDKKYYLMDLFGRKH